MWRLGRETGSSGEVPVSHVGTEGRRWPTSAEARMRMRILKGEARETDVWIAR